MDAITQGLLATRLLSPGQLASSPLLLPSLVLLMRLQFLLHGRGCLPPHILMFLSLQASASVPNFPEIPVSQSAAFRCQRSFQCPRSAEVFCVSPCVKDSPRVCRQEMHCNLKPGVVVHFQTITAGKH